MRIARHERSFRRILNLENARSERYRSISLTRDAAGVYQHGRLSVSSMETMTRQSSLFFNRGWENKRVFQRRVSQADVIYIALCGFIKGPGNARVPRFLPAVCSRKESWCSPIRELCRPLVEINSVKGALQPAKQTTRSTTKWNCSERKLARTNNFKVRQHVRHFQIFGFIIRVLHEWRIFDEDSAPIIIIIL